MARPNTNTAPVGAAVHDAASRIVDALPRAGLSPLEQVQACVVAGVICVQEAFPDRDLTQVEGHDIVTDVASRFGPPGRPRGVWHGVADAAQ